MKIIKYQEIEHKKVWDQFVLSANNGTIFHLREFLSYHKKRKFDDASFIFYDKNNIKSVFTGAIINNTLYSHPGASFGGFVSNTMSFKSYSEMVALLINYAKTKNLEKIIIIPPPFIYYTYYNEAMEYALYNQNFEVVEYYISSFIPLDKDFKKHVHTRKKRYIKKMMPEVEIKISADIDSFYPILINNKAKHKVEPTHTLTELKVLMKKFPEKIKLLLSYKNNTVIGGALNFITNKNTSILFYNMIDYDYQDLQIGSLQIYQSLKWAKENKLNYLDIGVSQLYKKNIIVPHNSLIHFKEQFGAQAMIRKVMELKL